MSALTPEIRDMMAEIAARHGLTSDAVETMLIAVANGNGMQAQFNHPELGGMGQWSQGGMTMVGDMFNHGLKARVDALCSELSQVVMTQRVFAVRPAAAGASSQSSAQSQSNGPSFFMAGSGGPAWPENLGFPASTGAQNDMRYGVFPSSRRLAVDIGGRVEVYDTGDHHISGVSQQQSGDRSLTFTSQHGIVRLSDLRRVEAETPASSAAPSETAGDRAKAADKVSVPAEFPTPQPTTAPESSEVRSVIGTGTDEIIALIQKLADLKAGGILTEAEFDAKKTELLSRL